MNLDNVNNIVKSSSGGYEGVLLINKPANVTSHDIVDHVRKVFKGSKVGHAGTLDPFATGLLIILVGKYTSQSDSFLGLPKSYLAKVLIGVSTDSMDTEGRILQVTECNLTEVQLQSAVNNFPKQYNQTVPVFSSIKVDGEKLRILARKYASFEVIAEQHQQVVHFKNQDGKVVKQVVLPPHHIILYEMEMSNFESGIIQHEFVNKHEQLKTINLATIDLKVTCSKGTYIRSLAQDLAASLNMPGMLINLERLSVGELSLSQALTLAQLEARLAQIDSLSTR